MSCPQKPSAVRVLMARRVAHSWMQQHAKPEYRITVYHTSSKLVQNLPGLLRAFRDRKTKIAGMSPVTDLGVTVGMEHLVLRSGNREAMVELDQWLTRVGCETTGIW